MYIHRVPYGLVEWLFGKTIADNFNEISLALCLIGALISLFIPRKTKVRRYRKPDKRPIYVEEDENGRLKYKGVGKNKTKEEKPIQEEYFGQYDRYSNLTDEEMKLAKQIRVERKEPSYEEWRAAQQRKKKEEPKKTSEGESKSKILKVEISENQIKEIMQTESWRVAYEEAPKEKPKIEPKPQKEKTGYEEAYKARQILTYNERQNYKTLKEAADKKGYTVQIKMRLVDIVKPRTGEFYDKYYKANFQRISQYHVDFTILNDRMKVVAIIELDDSSHDRPDRIARDEKIDSILKANQIKIIHTRYITPDILDGL